MRQRVTGQRGIEEGIDYAFGNGVMVVEGERHTGALPGKVLVGR